MNMNKIQVISEEVAATLAAAAPPADQIIVFSVSRGYVNRSALETMFNTNRRVVKNLKFRTTRGAWCACTPDTINVNGRQVAVIFPPDDEHWNAEFYIPVFGNKPNKKHNNILY
jgi:hypothetical protein